MQPLTRWLDLLGSDNLEIRARAARHLVRRADVPLDTLVAILEELSDQGLGADTRQALLRRTDAELLDQMIACLDSPESFARATACDVLSDLGDRRATPHVLDLLDDPNWRVRAAAVTALGTLGDASARASLTQKFLDVGPDVNMEIRLHRALRSLGALDGLPAPSWERGVVPNRGRPELDQA